MDAPSPGAMGTDRFEVRVGKHHATFPLRVLNRISARSLMRRAAQARTRARPPREGARCARLGMHSLCPRQRRPQGWQPSGLLRLVAWAIEGASGPQASMSKKSSTTWHGVEDNGRRYLPPWTMPPCAQVNTCLKMWHGMHRRCILGGTCTDKYTSRTSQRRAESAPVKATQAKERATCRAAYGRDGIARIHC